MQTSFLKVLLVIFGMAWMGLPLQAQFTFTHVGGGATGSVVDNGNASYTFEGGGADIWDTLDEFDFYHVPINGNFDIRVRVESLEPIARWTKAGLMARESLDPAARMAFNRTTPSDGPTQDAQTGANDTRLAYRTGLINVAGANGGQHEDGTGAPEYPNGWLRLERVGNVINGYAANNGLNWRLQNALDTATWNGGALPGTLQVGLGVSRHPSGAGNPGAKQTARAEFRDYANVLVDATRITRQPANVAAFAGSTATFTVGVAGGLDAFNFEWSRDGAPIPGATGPTYTTPPVVDGDNGAEFSVRITNKNNGTIADSQDAVLTVPSAPRVLSASSLGNPNGVCVFFSEAMANSALTTGNYQVSDSGGNLTITGAQFGENNTIVILSIQQTLVIGTLYTVTVSGATDLGGNPIDPAANSDTFIHGSDVAGQFSANFNDNVVPSGTSLAGNAANVSEGRLKLTPPQNDSWGVFTIDDFNAGAPLAKFSLSFDFNFFGSGCCGAGQLPADGASINLVANPPAPAYGTPAEEGFANASVAIGLDTWDNGGGEAPAIDIFVRGLSVARHLMQVSSSPTGGTADGFRTVTVNMDPDGTVDLRLGNQVIFNNIATSYSPDPGSKWVFGARTGGANDNHWFDNISIKSFNNLGPVTLLQQPGPADQTVPENAQIVYRIDVDGTPPYEIQWYRNGDPIAGANGFSLSFQAKPSRDHNANFHAVVNNKFSQATSSTAHLNVTPDTAPPVLTGAQAVGFVQVRASFSEPIDPASIDTFAMFITGGPEPVSISQAVLDGANRVLLTTSRLAPDTTYTLEVNGIMDLAEAANQIADGSTATFSTPFLTRGFLERNYYGVVPRMENTGGQPSGSVPGGGIDTVLNFSQYINNTPQFRCFSHRAEFNTFDEAENYGGSLRGFYAADEDGEHIFYIAADDPAILYISTDENPANKVNVAIEPQWTNRREWTGNAGGRRPLGTENVSPIINLVKGRFYYVEAVFKEGGGGDHVAFAVKKPSQASAPANGSLPVANVNLAVIATGVNTTVNITEQPQSQTVNQNQRVTLSMNYSATTDACMKIGTEPGSALVIWQVKLPGASDFQDVPGAFSRTLTTGLLQPADDNTQYRAIAHLPGGRGITQTAVLHVIPDVTPPQLLSAASANGTQIGVQLDEPIVAGEGGALDPFAWFVNGGAVSSVLLRSDGMGVVITIPAENAVGATFTVQANGLEDLVGNTADTLNITGTRWLENVTDVGGPTPPGQHFTAAVGNIEIRAGGADVWGTSDQMTYAYKHVQGNFDVRVRVDRVDYIGNPWSKGGLNIRKNLNGDAQTLAWFYPTPLPPGANQNEYARRSTDGGNMDDVGQPRPSVNSYPLWLRVRRIGTLVTAFNSRDGVNWTGVGPANQNAPSYPFETLLGVAAVSHLNGTLTTAGFSSLGDVVLYPNAVVTVTGPDDKTANDNNFVTFTVTGSAPGVPASDIWYQWEQETAPGSGTFAPIPLQAAASYTRLATLADDGLHFRCVVSAAGSGAVTSRAALLHVIVDVEPPVFASAKGNASFDQIKVTFNEPMDPDGGYLEAFAYAVFGPGDVPLGVAQALPGANTTEVILVLSAATPLFPNSTHRVVSGGITDLAGNAMVDGTYVEFDSFVLSCGFAKREFYFDIGGGVAVNDLRNAAKYPNSPDQSDFFQLLETPTNIAANFGGRVSGFLKPTKTGAFDFFIAADDNAEMWLSTDASPANKVLICREPQWGGVREYTGNAGGRRATPGENLSTTLFPDGISLTQGSLYYFEALYKEGGGGDNLAVAATDHGVLPANGSSPITGGFQMVVAADPIGANINITQQPQNAIVGVNCVQEGSTLVDESFDSSDGAFTQTTSSANPWAYNAAAGSWRAPGTGSGPSSATLASPTYTFTRNGLGTLTLQHRYIFEYDGTRWDGGQIRVSINGGAFNVLSDFSQGGYVGNIQGNNILNGQPAYNDSSPGYGAGTMITSIANLGNRNAGDTIRFQFIGAWDESVTFANPNWEISSFVVTQGATPPAASFFANFDDNATPSGTALFQNASINNGRLELTSNANGQMGGFVISDFNNGQPVSAFNVNFKVRMGDSTCCGNPRPADGFSFNFGVNAPNGAVGEEGAGTGLIVSFDTWDNDASDTAPAIEVKFNNTVRGVVSMDGVNDGAPARTPIPNDSTGNPATLYTGNRFVEVTIRQESDGTVDVIWDGVPVLQNIATGATPVSGGRWTFGGRTGGANETHWIDDLSIGLGGGASPISFTVAANGSITGVPNHPVFIQWQKNGQDIPGATSATLATTATAADDGTKYRAQIYVPGKVAASQEAEVIVTQAPRVNITSPSDGSQVATCAGIDVTIRATASDPDGSVANVAFVVQGLGTIGVDNNGADGWSLSVPNPAPGLYLLTAVATDNLGVRCESGPVLVEVVPNRPAEFNIPLTYSSLEDSGPVSQPGFATGIVPGPHYETGQNVSFEVSNSNPALFSIQPAISPNGTLTYVSAPNASGSANVTVIATDDCSGGDSTSDPQTFALTIVAVCDPPTCSDVSATACEDAPTAIILPASDVDAGDVLTAVVVTPPAYGTVVISGTTATYTGNQDYSGPDSFTYRVVDACGGLSSGVCTVSINVLAVNDAPKVVIKVSPTIDLGPTVPGTHVISGNNIGACVQLDGTATTDPDSPYSDLSFTWLVDGVPVGTGDTLEDVCLLVGARTVQLVVSDGHTGTGGVCSDAEGVGTQTTVVNVLTGADVNEDFIEIVYGSTIDRKNKQQFIATLKTAAAAFERGSTGAGLNMMEAFINKCEAQLKDNPDVQAEWIRIASEIIEGINNPVECDGCTE